MANLDDKWFVGIDLVRHAFEARGRGTLLGEPGKLIAELPGALGGDPKQRRLLAAPAKGTPGFFALLAAKAHFLMLPKRIVNSLNASGRVSFSEADPGPGAAGDTIEREGLVSGRSAEMHIPGASDGLVWAGHEFGREALFAATRAYSIVGTIYHELTHSWLWLQEYAGAGIQKLHSDGLAAYGSAVGVKGTSFAPHQAFTEAAGEYVEDRIVRWCVALSRLNSYLLTPPDDPDSRRDELRWTAEDYDKFVPVYGVVDFEKIESPALPVELRKAIDREILDGLQLVERFDDTALAGLRSSLLSDL